MEKTEVPYIDLKRIVAKIKSKVTADWDQVLDNCEFVAGPRITQLENKITQILKVPYGVCCANGTDAIFLALQALGIGPGKKVAIPNLTFWATYEAVANIGAVPVLLDTEPQWQQMSFDELKKAHATFGLDAAVIVHLFGFVHPQIKEIRTWCAAQNIRLVEDGAQSWGVKLNSEGIYSKAEAATVSFYPAKVIGSCMDGGAITFRDKAPAELARSLANHGRSAHYSYSHSGWNSRMSGLSASYLLRVLEIEEELLSSRRQAMQWYGDFFSKAGLESKVRFVTPPQGVTGNGYLAVCELQGSLTSSWVQAELKKAGIGSAGVYPETMAQQPPAKDAKRVSEMPISTGFCKRVVNLPMFALITRDEVEFSVRGLARVLKGAA